MRTRHAREVEALAGLVTYPQADYAARLAACRGVLAAADGTDGSLAAFASRVEGLTLEELQERFTGTFDLNPACTLDVGWHLFGEQYERGAFLVDMREMLRAHGIAESVELPDHLPHLLTLLGRQDPARAADLATRAIAPALDRILAALEGQDNLFEPLLRAIAATVAQTRNPS
ncbi:MAG: nitrate reductase molybdenum cofactor assembly chaperone [Acidobacteria bacterium RIFCSPLOWO2_12_FULL_67_14]|nr:MAG: nitrate reductase molybdenum cofactor assembly chaperone [Acidobacteria bacterium RIFCSPLOWO2_12_FULL_67_14]